MNSDFIAPSGFQNCRSAHGGVTFRFGFERLPSAVPYVVAIPARNEQSRILSCLQACLESMKSYGALGAVVLAINNTTDQTASIAASWSQEANLPLEIISTVLPSHLAHAGSARRLAMDRARYWLDEAGALLTTDADSMPKSAWVAENLSELSKRQVLVCGGIEFDRDEVAGLPPGALATGDTESLYKVIAAELDHLLDPDPTNPWPHHGQISGASLAMRASAYDLIGGIPVVPLGEDRALARAFREHGLPVLYSSGAKVVTSCRLVGRAVGGMAETIALRLVQDDYLCDESLETADRICRRAGLRAELRQAMTTKTERLEIFSRLRLRRGVSEDAEKITNFIRLWALLEKESPMLKRKQMLRREMELATPRLIAVRDSILKKSRYRRSASSTELEGLGL